MSGEWPDRAIATRDMRVDTAFPRTKAVAVTVGKSSLVLFVLVLAAMMALTLLPAPAQATHRPRQYCSESGDVCAQTIKDDGVRLQIGSFAFRGRYRLCVTTPDEDRTCKEFRMRERASGLYASNIRWARHFPTEGPGAYRVSWHKFGSRIGPVLGFHIK